MERGGSRPRSGHSCTLESGPGVVAASLHATLVHLWVEISRSASQENKK